MRRSRLLVAVIALVAVSLVLSGCGPRVPNVVGMKQAEAVRALEDGGYKLGEVSFVATDAVPLGTIAAQSPAANERLREGGKVDLAISFTNGKQAIVPNVTGMSSATAEQTAKTLRMTPLITKQYDDTVPSDQVATQSPPPYIAVPANITLVIVVSKGPAPKTAKVPDVKGKSQADAESAIEAAGFVPEVFTGYHNSVAKGKVVGQAPQANNSLQVGSKVKIMVSLGKGTGAASVPSVTGKSEADAASAISGAGLKVQKAYQNDASVPSGKVIVQFPDAGTTTAAGSEVLIVISRGPETATTVTVPNVVGKTKSEAQAALDQAGLVADAETPPGATGDKVTFQFPAANTKAAPGSGVLIVVGEPAPAAESPESTPTP